MTESDDDNSDEDDITLIMIMKITTLLQSLLCQVGATQVNSLQTSRFLALLLCLVQHELLDITECTGHQWYMQLDKMLHLI